MRSLVTSLLLCLAMTVHAMGGAPVVTESARDVPLAYDVDVVVVGGSTGAVAAAVAAAKAGAKVFLAAPEPYLGDDVAATLRLWLEPGEEPASPLAKALFAPRAGGQPARIQNALPFKYQSDKPSVAVHKDTNPPSRLSDGEWGNPSTQSVQFDGDVTLLVDLLKVQQIKQVYLVVYHRPREQASPFIVESATVSASDDQKDWRDLTVLENAKPEGECVALTAPVAATTRYLRFSVKKPKDVSRVLLGEIVVVGAEEAPAAPPPAAEEKPPAPPATPLQVKRALDEALLAAKVDFLYSCFATDVLRDADGKPAGIIMANRAGRQAVRAKVIVDATSRAWVARMAGASFRPFPAGVQTVARVVIGGLPHPAANATVREIKPAFGGSGAGRGAAPKSYPIYEYTLQIPMRDGAYASWAAADQAARDVTYDPAQQFTSDVLFQVPPDPMKGAKSVEGDWAGAEALDLGAFRPAGLERLFVLGGCADIPRASAARLLRPLALIDMGTRVGAAAAAEAKALPALADVKLPGAKAAPALKGDVHETLEGVRPVQSLPTIRQEERPLPVLGRYDVVVIGGGTGGAPAGIGAAREGAKTLVVEYLHGLGGVGTLGAIAGYYHGNKVGFSKEVQGGAGRWEVEQKAEWWRSELRKAKADIWFGAVGVGAFVDDGRVRGAVVATPEGRGVVLANTVIDSTGNADIAAASGVPCIYTDADEIAVQGTGLPPRQLGASYTNTDFTIVDDTDMIDVWSVFVYAKVKARNAFDIGQLIDTRERRRVVGDVTLSILDEVNDRTYPDTVVQARSDYDSHGYTVDPYFLLEHPGRRSLTTSIPYRAMLPVGLDGMLVTGLGISAQRDAVPVIRMQPDIQNGGYAAGVAGAMAAKAATSVRKLNIKALQKKLVEVGNLTPSVLTDKDSYPLPAAKVAAAVRSVQDGYKGVSVLLAQPDQALPLLRQAYAEASPQHKLIYAHILGIMGDPTGLPTLIEAVDAAEKFDKGWDYRGMGQYGNAMSPLDSLIVALGRAGDRRATPHILSKLKLLQPASEFSHFRACALALEALRDPAAAGPLAEVLAKPGIRGTTLASIGQAIDREQRGGGGWTAVAPRRDSIRELDLARALFRCGDKGGLGRKVLEEYTRDLRGHFARHALAVLKEGEK